jgi:hypothetical protein
MVKKNFVETYEVPFVEVVEVEVEKGFAASNEFVEDEEGQG